MTKTVTVVGITDNLTTAYRKQRTGCGKWEHMGKQLTGMNLMTGQGT